jgi:hypothetical protein
VRLFNGIAAGGDEQRLRRLAREMLEDSAVGSVQRHAIREVLADLVVTAHPTAARRDFTALAADAPDDATRRRLLVKAHLAGLGAQVSGPLLEALRRQPGPDSPPEPLAMLAIAEAARRAPRDPLIAYLLARQHFRYDDFSGALRLLDEAEDLGLRALPAPLPLAAREMRARALLGIGRHREARRAFELIAGDATVRLGAREAAADWAERCAFLAALD